jgi:hypothetical protein
MAAAGRKRDIAIRVMVTAKEQREIRKAATKAAMPMSPRQGARGGAGQGMRGDLPTAFHEAGHVAAAWRHGLKVLEPQRVGRGGQRPSQVAIDRNSRRDRGAVAAGGKSGARARARTDFNRNGGQDPAGVAVKQAWREAICRWRFAKRARGVSSAA